MGINIGEPSYAILAHVVSGSHLNHMDAFCANLYISGDGDIDYGNIIVSIPPYLVKDDTIKYTHFKLVVQQSGNTNVGVIKKIDWTTDPLKGSRFFISLDRCFRKYCSSDLNFPGRIIGESDIDGEPPYRFEFTLAENAPSGDHFINIYLKYRSKSQTVYLDKQVLTIHVNYWYEKEWIKLIPIFSIIFALLSLIESPMTKMQSILMFPIEYILGYVFWAILIFIILFEFRKSSPYFKRII